MKLILCAGERHIDGFKTHDVQPLPGIDYVCDLFDIVKHIKGQSCDEIHLTHALEHFPTSETQKVLSLLHYLLKPGGKVYIEVPNFGWHAQLVMEGKDRQAVYYAFGGQLNEWDFHKTGFTPRILSSEMDKAGFKNVLVSGNDCLECHAIK